MDSILTSIKKMLGIAEEYEHFDADLIMCINSAFMILTQMGVGPSEGFRIEDKESYWDEFVDPEVNLESVKTYVFMKVKLMFDPPTSSAVMESMKNILSELEWRLVVEVETPTISTEGV